MLDGIFASFQLLRLQEGLRLLRLPVLTRPRQPFRLRRFLQPHARLQALTLLLSLLLPLPLRKELQPSRHLRSLRLPLHVDEAFSSSALLPLMPLLHQRPSCQGPFEECRTLRRGELSFQLVVHRIFRILASQHCNRILPSQVLLHT